MHDTRKQEEKPKDQLQKQAVALNLKAASEDKQWRQGPKTGERSSVGKYQWTQEKKKQPKTPQEIWKATGGTQEGYTLKRVAG